MSVRVISSSQLDQSGIVLPNGSTVTTQSQADNTTKPASTAYVRTAVAAIPPSTPPLVGACRNLIGSAAGSTKTASWTADQLVLFTALNGTSVIGASLSLSFNGATTGAGGMDTGTVPTSGTLYIYAIYNSTTTAWNTLGTTAGSGSEVYAGANMPSGYTHSALIYVGVTDASANIVKFNQIDRTVNITKTNAFTNAVGVTSVTAQPVNSVVPAKAKSLIGWGNGASNRIMLICSDSAGTIGVSYLGAGNGSASPLNTFYSGTPFNIPLLTAQTFYWQASDTGAQYTVVITGYGF